MVAPFKLSVWQYCNFQKAGLQRQKQKIPSSQLQGAKKMQPYDWHDQQKLMIKNLFIDFAGYFTVDLFHSKIFSKKIIYTGCDLNTFKFMFCFFFFFL